MPKHINCAKSDNLFKDYSKDLRKQAKFSLAFYTPGTWFNGSTQTNLCTKSSN